MRMMARVEGMPLESLRSGPRWDWRSFGDWMAHLDGRIAVNAGFLVGHSTIRRVVMGDDAVGHRATPDQIEAMVRLAHQAMDSGALGFSSSLGGGHTDGDGNPVPSRAAGHDEILALAAAVREHAGTTLEFIPIMGEIPPDLADLMAEMSLAADRPLNWNLLGNLSGTEIYGQQLEASDRAREMGAYVVALTLPDVMRLRSDQLLARLPGWAEVMDLGPEERAKAIADPETRSRLRAAAVHAPVDDLGALGSWDLVELAEATSDRMQPFVGRTIAAIATECGVEPADVLVDMVLPEGLPLTLLFPSLVPALGASDEGWQVRASVWRDERTVLGGSDAGAHLNLMCHANYTTILLSEAVRERKLLSLEAAVHQLTDVPARLYGLRGRGRVAEGWWADLVVFDPDRVGSRPARARYDLPAGGLRLYAEAEGIHHVLVNGEEIVTGGQFAAGRAGVLLRSGRDTETVTLSDARKGLG
jgi:N-acyl-D-aspartate/D-glutamate deacylase